MVDECTCPVTLTNPYATRKRADGTPELCTSVDACEACGGAGCEACQHRGYSQHCERVVIEDVAYAGWDARSRGLVQT